MQKNTNEKGITLIALTITIIVLAIISGITISASFPDSSSTQSNVDYAELEIIQHAILEKYSKNQLTNDNNFPGTKLTKTDVEEIINEINSKANNKITLKDENHETYYKLEKGDLETLGIKDKKVADSSYIVSYRTGEVLNENKPMADDGTVLYIWSKEVPKEVK